MGFLAVVNLRGHICLLSAVTTFLCFAALSCTIRKTIVYYTWGSIEFNTTTDLSPSTVAHSKEACEPHKEPSALTEPLKLVRKTDLEKWSKNFNTYASLDYDYSNLRAVGSCADPRRFRWVTNKECEHGDNTTLPQCVTIQDKEEPTVFAKMLGKISFALSCPCKRMIAYTGSAMRRILKQRAIELGIDKVQLVFVGESVFREVFSTLIRVLRGGDLPPGFDHRLQTRRHGHISYSDADVELYFYFLGGVYPYPLLNKEECPKPIRTGRPTKLAELCDGPKGVWKHILNPTVNPLVIETEFNDTEKVFPHDIARTVLVAYGAGVWDAAYCGNVTAFGREFREILRLIRDSGQPTSKFLVRNVGAGFGTDEHVKENAAYNAELLSSVRDVFGDAGVGIIPFYEVSRGRPDSTHDGLHFTCKKWKHCVERPDLVTVYWWVINMVMEHIDKQR